MTKQVISNENYHNGMHFSQKMWYFLFPCKVKKRYLGSQKYTRFVIVSMFILWNSSWYLIRWQCWYFSFYDNDFSFLMGYIFNKDIFLKNSMSKFLDYITNKQYIKNMFTFHCNKHRLILYLLCFFLSLIHIWRCRRYAVCRSRWSPYH